MIDTSKRQIFCFLGLPASGKGTQVQILSTKIGAQVLGIGNLIREEIENGNSNDPFYLDIKHRYDNGIPQADEVILDIVKRHLKVHKEQNIIFDNFPFSTAQAEEFFKVCESVGVDPVLIIVDIKPETAIKRIIHRKVCSSCEAVFMDSEATICEKCGGALISRTDDTIETVEKRIQFYQPRIQEVKDIFSKHNKVMKISGEGSVETVTKLINDEINDTE